jgi:RNA polymerase subunit RPABC4/transcription elongation factor Spt4
MSDTDNLVRLIILAGLGKVPVGGELISGLVGVFWPESGADVWDSIRADVEALINQQIAAEVYANVGSKLQGLHDVIDDYTTALGDSAGDLSNIRTTYTAAKLLFDSNLPSFSQAGSEVLLLPLFAQCVNLYLTLLRDGVMLGPSWGRTDEEIKDDQARLAAVSPANSDNLNVPSFVTYAQNWYQTGYSQIQLPGDSSHRIENWKAQNQYQRQMTLQVLDHASYWRFFDPTVNPGDSSLVLSPTRTIYSDPIGTADDTGINIPTPPTGPITGMIIWGWQFVDDIQIKLADDWGPRLGKIPPGSYSGPVEPPPSWSGDIDPVNNPVVRVTGRTGDMPDTLQLWFKDGSSTNVNGRGDSTAAQYDYSYDGHVLASVAVMGISDFYGSANCMVFGFRLIDSYENDGIQGNWRGCTKCQGLFYGGIGLSVCPVGGQHDLTGSLDYFLTNTGPGQDGWRHCTKCQGLFFSGNGAGVCPARGGHDSTGSANYKMSLVDPRTRWRWCRKCQLLFFAGDRASVCVAGGTHDPTGSGLYKLETAGNNATAARACNKCQSIVSGSGGICFAGDAHDTSNSDAYFLFTGFEFSGGNFVQSSPGQVNWWWCDNCQGLFFAGINNGVCIANFPWPGGGGGAHFSSAAPSPVSEYALASVNATGHENWRWCTKCQGLFCAYAGLPHCPAGGQHDVTGSFDYKIMSREET